jgi:hypothetical protein
MARLAKRRAVAKARSEALDAEWEQLLGRLHRDGGALRVIADAVNELPDAEASPQTIKNYADKHFPTP